MRASRGRLGPIKMAVALVAVGTVAVGLVSGWIHLRGDGDGSKAQASAANTFELAEALLSEDRPAEALQLLTPLAAKGVNAPGGPQLYMLMARAERMAGRPDEALAHLRHAARDFPTSPDQPRAAVAFARALEEAGQYDEAASVYEQVRRNAPPKIRAAALSGLGRRAEARNEPLAARELFHQASEDAEWGSPEWAEAIEALGRLNVALIFSTEATPESRVYNVQKGDNLTAISSKLNTTQGLLTRANGLDETTQLIVGQPLKYTPKDFRIQIERSSCSLFLRDKEGIFKAYRVGLGADGRETALGSYTIGNKEKDPAWHQPGGGLVPAGDPANPLGTRWMPLIPTQEGLPTNLGIQGTIEPETVGQYASDGCIRMKREDIEELFDLVVRGTPVEIVETCPERTRR